jgi:Domain of unknown function (DUF4815)
MANNTGTLTTNLNLEPYYDDFDPSKNIHRIIFKPKFPVQARELTQLQTILQNQIDRFGKHIFREGSIVLPGQFSIEKGVDYVKVNDLDLSSDQVTITDFLNKKVTGQTSGVEGIIIEVLDGVQSETNKKTIYVKYTNSGNDNITKVFANGETLLDDSGNSLVVYSSAATGKGARFAISEGVIFAKGHFIYFPTQSIIISRYTETPSCKVGFIVEESIATAANDESLLDPALGSSNYSAPGADRLKLTPYLEIYGIDVEESPDFVKLFNIREGVLEESYERTQYSIIRDELATRTYNESGDYYVRGLGVRIRENLDDGQNYGYSNTGNSQLLSIGIEPGTAYIKGYEIGTLVTKWITTEKGLATENINSQIATATIGGYTLVDEFVGAWNLDEGTQIQLYDTAQNRISTKGWSTASQTGINVGQARIKGLEYNSGIPGTANAQYKLYLFDINMFGSNSFANVKSVYYNNSTTADMGADTVLTNGLASLQESATESLLFSVGSPFVRSIRDTSGNPDTSFTFRRSEDISIASNGTFIITIAIGSEQSPYGTGSLTDDEKNDLILTVNENKNIALAGTVSGLGGNVSTVLTGSGTSFTNLNPGDKIEILNNTTYTISAITNATSIIVYPALSGATFSGNTITKAYKTGDIIDLMTNGVTGVERTVVSSPTTLTFDLKETFGSTTSGTINYKVARTSAREVAKVLRPSRYVRVNVANSGATTSGPFNLGFADIYQVRSIRKKNGSNFTSASEGTDVTSHFTVDNGQRDAYYDFGKISPKSSVTVASDDFLLVELDYFSPDFTQGVGYFSVDSYPINDNIVSNTSIKTEDIPVYRSPTSALTYDLRNYLDFRPVKTSTAADSTTVTGATTSPSTTGGFNSEANGLRIPVPSSQLTFDYSYYLPRKDVVIVDKDGNFSVVKGNPSVNPITPATPDNSMSLANMFIAPYPSLAPNYGQALGRADLSCYSTKTGNPRFTMRDIGVLKQRIVNLEYYASLNALERNAIEFQVLDENGLDRFKNGIFVDNFRDHSLGATYLDDYSIVVDKDEKTIRPIYTMDSIYLDLVSNTNIVFNSGLATLPFTEKEMFKQGRATTFRNIELSSYRFIGNMYLMPETDVWVDTQYLPDNAVTIGSDETDTSVTTEWNAWQTSIVGYRLIRADNGQVLANFGANQRDLAYNNAYWLARNREIDNNTIGYTGSKISTIVETVYQSNRTGTQSYNTIYEDTESLGDRVVDVNIIPYIRPQIININARGLKANTKLFTYFDGEDMSDYVIPYTPTQATKNLIYQMIQTESGIMSQFDPNYVDLSVDSTNEGDPVISDANGEVFLLLRLPEEKRFRVGTKEVKLTDSPTNEDDDATTVSVDYFVAQGLVQTKQETILTTRQVIPVEKDISESTSSTTQYVQSLRPSCMAYSFLAKAPEGEEGLFATGFDIYLAAKSSTLGIWFEIREMDNGGGITRNQVPFSEVWLRSDQVTVSDDASTPTRITFPAPVFLYNDTQYALVIHTEGINPDYYIWVSRLGETNILDGNRVTARPLTGTLFTTNNNLNWDVVPDTDLMVTMYRAAFNTGVTGTLLLGNKPVEKIRVTNPSANFSYKGEPVVGDDKITLTAIGGPTTIAVGDYLIGNTTNSNTTVTAINGAIYTMADTGFVLGERVTAYHAANMVSKGVTANISLVTTGSGFLNKYVTKGGYNTLHLTGSNGTFFTGSTIRGKYSGHYATIDSFANYRYSVMDIEPSYINFHKTTCSFESQTTSNTGTKGDYYRINENENYVFNTEQAIYSRVNEIASLSGNKSNNVRVSMASTTEYLSPVFDITRSHVVYVDNLVNANSVGETEKSGGGLINRYISKTVTLAEGQDAEDLVVVLTAYRPPTTDVKVYFKVLNNEDADTLDNKNWIELEYLDDTVYSSQTVTNDFIEYNFKVPAAMLTGPNAELRYTTSSGTTFTGFKRFAIKIGLLATNSAVVPRVGDLQVLALQK